MNPDVVLGLIGATAIIVVLFELLRRGHLREKYAVLWFFVAIGIVVIAVFPAVLRFAADLVGVEVASNLLFFVGSLVLLLMSVQHSYELGRLEEKTRTLAEEVALLRVELRRTDGHGAAPHGELGGPSAGSGAGPTAGGGRTDANRPSEPRLPLR